MSTYIGFNLNSNRQIEHFQTIENLSLIHI